MVHSYWSLLMAHYWHLLKSTEPLLEQTRYTNFSRQQSLQYGLLMMNFDKQKLKRFKRLALLSVKHVIIFYIVFEMSQNNKSYTKNSNLKHLNKKCFSITLQQDDCMIGIIIFLHIINL
jgi:hypothetical protein